MNNCNELPNFSILDQWFISNKDNLSILLNDLSVCENNHVVCVRYHQCKKENYQQHSISSGNTIIEWKKVPECPNKKGAILISYTSGCEIEKINNFINQNSAFSNFPIDYYNY